MFHKDSLVSLRYWVYLPVEYMNIGWMLWKYSCLLILNGQYWRSVLKELVCCIYLNSTVKLIIPSSSYYYNGQLSHFQLMVALWISDFQTLLALLTCTGLFIIGCFRGLIINSPSWALQMKSSPSHGKSTPFSNTFYFPRHCCLFPGTPAFLWFLQSSIASV